ncbi:MAG: YjhX family toxin [Pikeienuella sp.]
MNISKAEQRVLHALAQGGVIRVERNSGGKVAHAMCVTRDGYILVDCTLKVFRRLRSRRLISSQSGAPYQIARRGRLSVRAQLDNR